MGLEVTSQELWQWLGLSLGEDKYLAHIHAQPKLPIWFKEVQICQRK